MKQVTLRFPEVGFDRLMRLCERHGLSIRALFEAATLVALEDEADPERHQSQVNMWSVVARLQASEAFRAVPRHKLVVAMDDDIFEAFHAACERFGVSQNAALGLVVMPWPEETPQECIDYRRGNVARIVERARRLEFLRKRGISSDASLKPH